jgi:3-dehydro-L-gulonate 2-dehydrogenase
MLDLLASILSGGRSTHEIPSDPERESRISQVFITINSSQLEGSRVAEEIVNNTITDFRAGKTASGEPVRYPGEQVLKIRRSNLEHGIPIDAAIWEQVLKL